MAPAGGPAGALLRRRRTHFARERDARPAARVVLRRPARRPRPGRPGPARRRRRGRRERARHRRRGRRAARVRSTSAATAARRSCRSSPARSRCAPCAAKSLRCPYHSWTYGLDGRLLRAPHTEDVEDFDPRGFGLQPVGVGGVGRLRLRAPGAGGEPDRCRRSWARCRSGSCATRSTGSSSGARFVYDGRGQLEGHRRELQRVLPLRPACTPSWSGWCRRSAGGGADLDWDGGVPHARGRVDVHHDRHDRPAAVPGPRRGRAGAAQGRARLPEPDAQPVRRPRRRVRPGAARPSTAPRSCCDSCSTPTRWRDRRSTSPTRLTSGTWSTGRTGRSASRCSAACPRACYTQGWFAPMEDASLDIRRWLLPRLGLG